MNAKEPFEVPEVLEIISGTQFCLESISIQCMCGSKHGHNIVDKEEEN
jgi:hypothetical protein